MNFLHTLLGFVMCLVGFGIMIFSIFAFLVNTIFGIIMIIIGSAILIYGVGLTRKSAGIHF